MASADESEIVSQESIESSSQSEKIQFEIVPSSRSGQSLLYTVVDKQLFRKNRKYRGGNYYMCRITDCPARVFLDSAGLNCIKGKKQSDHNHSHNQQSDFEELSVKHKIKTDCEALTAMDGSTQISAIFQRNVRE